MQTSSNAPGATPLPIPTRSLLTVKQLAQQQPGLTTGGIRWDLYNRGKNGLMKSGAIIQRGRRILIDPEKYLGWMEKQGSTEAAP